MRSLRDLYYLLFYFWFRLDLLTKSRENKALKALGAVTIVQVWFVFGSYLWGEMLLGFPALKREAILALGAVLLVANYVVLRRRGWEEFEKRFALCSARSRLGWLAVAGTASVAAFSVFLGAGTAARSGR